MNSTNHRLAINKLLTEKSPTDEAIQAFFDEQESFPIVEGPNVTFIYRGAADAVFLRHWIFGLTSHDPFERIGTSDLWYKVESVPPNSRVEYKLEVKTGDEQRLINDPLNDALAHDPFGANSVCHGVGYIVPEWTRPDAEAREGTLVKHVFQSESFGDRRVVSVYLPARFRRTRRYPLLLVHDGSDFLRYANFKTVLDNLMHRLEIPAMIVALLDPQKRFNEYTGDEHHARYVAKELLPWLEEQYPLLGTPQTRCLMGASLGAVASFTTAFEYPDLFGRLLLQSGSFAFTDIGENRRGPVFAPIVEFMNDYREDPKRISEKLFVSCGTYESLIYENRSLVPVLQSTGMNIRYAEARDGHNWENWRDRLREGLSWLFPGPLWMVYE